MLRTHLQGPTIVLEKNNTIGEETSSRNSEVIHAGIYYPKDSIKTRACIAGNRTLYQLCETAGIRYRKLGKIIFSHGDTEGETEYLAAMKRRCDELDISMNWLSTRQLTEMEPNLNASIALHSPSTGIIDSHRFMEYLEVMLRAKGGDIAFNTFVSETEYIDSEKKYKIITKDTCSSPCCSELTFRWTQVWILRGDGDQLRWIAR